MSVHGIDGSLLYPFTELIRIYPSRRLYGVWNLAALHDKTHPCLDIYSPRIITAKL